MQQIKSIMKYIVFILSVFCIGTFFFVAKSRYNVPLSEEQILPERKVRDSAAKNFHQPYYYEEQKPVLVHAENYVNNAPFQNADPTNYYDERNYDDKDSNYDYDYSTAERQLISDTEQSEPVNRPTVTPAKSTFEVLISAARDFKTMYDIYKAFSAALTSTPVSNETSPVLHPRYISDENKIDDNERDKRQSTDLATKESGRYIKGDPLKGYYDFVITEGSYKFWAVFQVGTAILIIYSTFAAIYYSKVNPLTSDYDYADYLGASRSFNGENLDFVDPVDDNHMPTTENNNQTPWYTTLLPKIGRSLKTVLETIDKLNDVVEKPELYDKLLTKSQQVVYS